MSNKTLLRREFLGSGLALAACSARRVNAQAAAASKDAPATHNWMLVGSQTAFLSHLPMFDHLNKAGSDYVTPHRYQVILQVSFINDTTDLTELYFADRQGHPETKMFTVSPSDTFVLPDVAADQPVSSFDATVFRGHLERGGQPIPKLDDITVKVARVIHFHKFDPTAQPPTTLDYLIFGRGKELFLAHSIVKPPDFDQIVSIEAPGTELSDRDLLSAVRIHVPERKNTPSERIHEGQEVTGELASGAKMKIRCLREFYFEEGELLIPATFRSTKEEAKAGF